MSGRRRALRAAARWGPQAVVVLAAALFFSPFFLQGRVFVPADTLFGYLPWRAHVAPGFRPHNGLITDPMNHNYTQLYNEQLKAGKLAQWNPYIMCGLPANGVTAMSGMPGRYNPVKLLLHRFLEPPEAMTLLLFFHVTLMGLTMYHYLRRVGARWRGALFGAMAFMFNGTAMVWLEFENLVTAASFLPLLLLLMERFTEPGRRLAAAFLAAGTLGLVALMGHLQYLIYTALLLIFYLVFLLARVRRREAGPRGFVPVLGCFAVMCAGGALIGAVDLLPVLDMMRHSGRISRSFTFDGLFESLGRVPWRFYATLLFPFFFGSPHLGFDVIPRLPTQDYMNYNELCLYLGVPTLFGIAAALAAPKSRHSRFHLGMTLLVGAMMSGTVAYYPFFKLFPGMDRMNPTRLIFLFSFTAAAVSGIGVGRLGSLGRGRRRALTAAACFLPALALALAVFGASASGMRWLNREIFTAADVPIDQILPALSRVRGSSSPAIVKQLLLLTVACALFVAALQLRRRGLRTAAVLGLVALLAGDLISFGREYNTVADRREVYPKTPSIEFLQRQPGPFRVLLDIPRGLLQNTLAPFRIQEAGGYSSFYPEGTGMLMSALEYGPASLEGARLDRWVILSDPAHPALDIMNVRYVLTDPGFLLPEKFYRLVHQSDIAVYESLTALPRAWVVPEAVVVPDRIDGLASVASGAFDPRQLVVLEEPAAVPGEGPGGTGVATIERYDEDDVAVAVEATAPAWLVLADTWFPGWSATVQGKPAAILRANVNFRAVRVPGGRSRVEFAYRPASVSWGRVLTGLGLALVLGGLTAAGRPWQPRAGSRRWRG